MDRNTRLAQYILDAIAANPVFFTGSCGVINNDGTVNVRRESGNSVNAIAANITGSGDCAVFQVEGEYYAFSTSVRKVEKEAIAINRRRKREVEVESANIKILFSKIEDTQRVFYVLDEKSKKQVLSIDKNIFIDSIQGNLFNYGVRNKYTNSIQYYESNNLNALNIVGSTDYPLWDVTQIGFVDFLAYHGSSILESRYLGLPSKIVNEQTVITFTGVDGEDDTVKKEVYTYDITLLEPNIYRELSGNQETIIYSTFNALLIGEIGFSGYITTSYNGIKTLRGNSKSFYADKNTTNQFDFGTSIDTSEIYSFLDSITTRLTTRLINENRITTGKSYLGKYVKNEISDSYTFQEDSIVHIEYTDTYNTNTEETLNLYTLISKLNVNLLLIEGIKSSIICQVDYVNTTVKNLIANTRSDEPVDNCVYSLNSGDAPIALNRTNSIVINGFGTKIVDENTAQVINRNYDSLLTYIGQSVSYAQYIDENNCWLAKGTLTSVTPLTIISLTSITKVPFVSYATTDGTAISDNGSLFTLLNVFNTRTNIINRYILDPSHDTNYLASFTELLKYGCLIGNKFYICQNNEAVKTTKTNLYIEQWDIGSNGDVARNDKLIKLPVDSLNSADSIIHSIQYWSKN